MFTPTERTRLRETLIAAAHDDPDVVGAALVGSAAAGREDAWSDIDLVLQIARAADPDHVAARWTDRLYSEGAADQLDVIAGGVLYRVYLLASSLQVDLSFWPEEEFRGTEPEFELLFGTPQPSTTPQPPDTRHLIGMAWLYALHARSAIARSRTWQAVMMLDHLRDQLLALACVRYDLNPHHGREADRLPEELRTGLAAARAASTAGKTWPGLTARCSTCSPPRSVSTTGTGHPPGRSSPRARQPRERPVMRLRQGSWPHERAFADPRGGSAAVGGEAGEHGQQQQGAGLVQRGVVVPALG